MSVQRFFAAFILATAAVATLGPAAAACGEDAAPAPAGAPAHHWAAPGLPGGHLF